MCSQVYSLTSQRPPATQSKLLVKCSESRMANSSVEEMPSLATAKTVFFWVSVGTTLPWSPTVWASVKSPRSWEVTDSSVMRWRGWSRSTFMTRTSALPYWFSPRTIVPVRSLVVAVMAGSFGGGDGGWADGRRLLAGSAAPVGGERERAEQAGHVVVVAALLDEEVDVHRGVEGRDVPRGEVLPGGKAHPVDPRLEPRRAEVPVAPVGVGDAG